MIHILENGLDVVDRCLATTFPRPQSLGFLLLIQPGIALKRETLRAILENPNAVALSSADIASKSDLFEFRLTILHPPVLTMQ
ncbi:hypothetical protein TNCV_990171 [Trichonephila clavipes]|nr:hypothetical protein TNCV_990171 [Trichonephila clavipes]